MKKIKFLVPVFVLIMFVSSASSANAVMQSLNGLSAQSQTFTNDVNIRVNSSGSAHTLQFINSLAVSRGGTGQKTLTSGQILFGDTVASISQSAELFWDKTNSRMGIGTSIPSSKLTISGNMSIGVSYASVSAPANGLIIQGNVGIGNTAPAYKLDVTGQINATGGLCIAGDCKTSWPVGIKVAYEHTFRAPGSSTGTQTFTHGLGVVPKLIRLTFIGTCGSQRIVSEGRATSTSNQSTIWYSLSDSTDGAEETHLVKCAGSVTGDLISVSSQSFTVDYTTYSISGDGPRIIWEVLGD